MKNMIKNCMRLGFLGLAFLVGIQTSQAALITAVDEGGNTRISWSGNFDSTGLGLWVTFVGTEHGSGLRFSSDSVFFSDDEVTLLNGSAMSSLEIFAGLMMDSSSGWTEPTGDRFAPVVGDSTGLFFFNVPFGAGGFTNEGDGSILLSGTLNDNGFTANEWIVLENPNVAGDTGEIRFQTFSASSVPEPSSTFLLTLATFSFLIRRRRNR